jgi:hypothetical protein
MVVRSALALVILTFVAAVGLTVLLVDNAEVGTGALAARTASPTATPLPPATSGPLARQSGSSAEYERITSDLGGWSMEIPAAWTAAIATLRGADIASFDMSSAANSGNAPANDQIRIRIILDPRYSGLSLEQAGASGVPPSLIVDQMKVKLSGSDAVRTLRRAYQPTGSPFDQMHVLWTVRSPYFSDRVAVIDAWPADGALRSEADRAVSTLQLFAPRPLPEVPQVSRQEAIAKAKEVPGAVQRVAVKLTTFGEWINALAAEQAKVPGGPQVRPGPSPDPDQLVWVTVVAGDLGPMTKGGPPLPGSVGPAPVPPTTRWIVRILDAASGADLSGIWSPNGDWPAWFDALRDRAP